MKITIRNSQKKIPINPAKIKKTILKAFSARGAKSGEITICFVSGNKIQRLNKKYLKRDIPTDVLAFDISDRKKSKYIVADIVVSADAAVSNAGIYKTTPLYELYLYVIHGILHILGYQDDTERRRASMQKKAEAILRAMRLTHSTICPAPCFAPRCVRK